MTYVSNTDRISTSALYDLNYLAHHGIKGQKWGVRRFQNEDGSLKAAGKGRYDGTPVGNSGGKDSGSQKGEKKSFVQKETERGRKRFENKKGEVSVAKVATSRFRSKLKAAGKVGLGTAGTLGIALGAQAAQLTAAGAALLASPLYAPLVLAPITIAAASAVIGRGRDRVDSVLAGAHYTKKAIGSKKN